MDIYLYLPQSDVFIHHCLHVRQEVSWKYGEWRLAVSQIVSKLLIVRINSSKFLIILYSLGVVVVLALPFNEFFWEAEFLISNSKIFLLFFLSFTFRLHLRDFITSINKVDLFYNIQLIFSKEILELLASVRL